MIWALLAFAVLIVIVVLLGAFLILQGISQTLSNALSTVERVHTNDGKRIDAVLDRLMAMDFETFKNYQLAEMAEEGGVDYPEEEEADVRVEVPGITRNLGELSLAAAAAERRILEEDFPREEVEA